MAETGFEITNDLDINLRQKPGYEVPGVTITNGTTEASLKICSPVGSYQLILESTDVKSPLSTPSVLKTDVINLSVTASTTNQQAFDCGQLSADGQTNAISATYEVRSGNLDVPLPVINHITGFTLTQVFQSGVLTLADGTTQSIAAGDTAALAAIGVTIETTASTATLKVNVSNNAYSGSTLTLMIKDTVVEETSWFDTTIVTINLTRPQNLFDPKALRFEHELEPIILRVGQKFEWTLPKVLNAYMNNYQIVAKPDLRLIRYVTFNPDSNTMFYNDLHGSN